MNCSRQSSKEINPTRLIPTSLRPNLYAILQQQGLQDGVIDRLYDLMRLGSGDITEAKLDSLFGAAGEKGGVLDYYDFIKLLGPHSVSWR
jgi:hypothetical protein